ncbi:MAG: hypothetical protein IJH91_00400 [Mogibacterium sp.]|nr:hypothetical protein [Mogibacterium sp.]
MSKTTRHGKCRICGDPNGDPFFYYTARKIGTSYSENKGVYKTTRTTTTTFRDVTRHEDFICKKCRRKGYVQMILINICLTAACCGLFNLLKNSRQTLAGLLMTAGIAFGFIAITLMIGYLIGGMNGSKALADYHAKHDSYGYTYMSEGEASRLRTR